MAVGTSRVVVKGKNIDVTEALRNHCQRQAKKLEKFFAHSQEMFVEAVLSVQREIQEAEVTLQVGGLLIRAESRTSDMYASIDIAFDNLERQIRKNKTRLQRRSQGPKLSETFSNEFPADIEGGSPANGGANQAVCHEADVGRGSDHANGALGTRIFHVSQRRYR